MDIELFSIIHQAKLSKSNRCVIISLLQLCPATTISSQMGYDKGNGGITVPEIER